MTSPIGRTGRDPMTPGSDMPGDDRPAADADRPDADQIVPGPGPGPAARGNGAPVPDDSRVVPDEPATPDDPIVEEQVIVDDDQLVLGKDDQGADGSVAAGARPTAGSATVITDLPQDPGPASTGSAAAPPGPAMAPGAGPASSAPGGAAADPARTSASARWPEIQAMFVDDPRASVELAAGLTDDSVEELIASLKERQHALLTGWQRSGAGTEELRTALQGYRTFWQRLEALAGQF